MTQPVILDPGTDLLQDVRDDFLVEKMSQRGSSPKAANAILEVLFERHKTYLYSICLKRFGDQLAPEGVEELVSDTFFRAWKKSHLFKHSQSNDPDEGRKLVRAWLGKIANRLFLTRHRKAQGRAEDEMRSLPPDAASRRMLPPSGLDEIVRNGIVEALNDKERIVLRASAQHYNVDSGNFEISEDLIEQLALELSMLPVSLRQVRRRALKKLRKYVEENVDPAQIRSVS